MSGVASVETDSVSIWREYYDVVDAVRNKLLGDVLNERLIVKDGPCMAIDMLSLMKELFMTYMRASGRCLLNAVVCTRKQSDSVK